ncbi:MULTISPECIES: CYTH domain-containing protein [Bacillus]|uniref:CYTH domain-containing protein n=1 Tax=Bacillus TaxID=1386 RepID=UPI000305744B|nr:MULTISPECIES: CYTH domain-containing protein [Bacillus]
MKQEIEIEFKNLITEKEFRTLCEKFSITEKDFKYQINHYFDTEDFSLKNHQSALRIREKNHSFTLTLKQPHNEGLLETHEELTEAEAQSIISNDKSINGSISNILQKDFDISANQLISFGSLATKRAEINYKGGILVLDHSSYLGNEDFELEYEVTDFSTGKEYFDNLLQSLNIPHRKTDNKIKRFYNAKFK